MIEVDSKSRLDEYDKTISPSLSIAQTHDDDSSHSDSSTSESESEFVVNEHSQQRVTTTTLEDGSGFIPFLEGGQKKPDYVEIQRDAIPDPVTVKVDLEVDVKSTLPPIITDEPAKDTTLEPLIEEPLDATTSTQKQVYFDTTTGVPLGVESDDDESDEDQYAEEIDLVAAEGGQQRPTLEELLIDGDDLVDEEFFVTPTEKPAAEVETTPVKEDEVVTTTEKVKVEVEVNEDEVAIATTGKPQEVVDVEDDEQEVSTTEGPEITTRRSSLLGSLLSYFLPNKDKTGDDEDVEITTKANEDDLIDLETAATTEKDPVTSTAKVTTTSTEQLETLVRKDHPKAIDVTSVNDDEGVLPPNKFLHDKLDAVVKKREELIKNWVARKYKNKKKVNYILAPTAIPGSKSSSTDEAADVSEDGIPFAPTIPPKSGVSSTKFFHVDVEHTVRDKSLADKYSKARKKVIVAKKKKKPKKKAGGIPRGSNPNLFRKWGGDSLSQAEFERTVLGVSTATEVSVKSRICVRGRCFDADKEKFTSKKR